MQPTSTPTGQPSMQPTMQPSSRPTSQPSSRPSTVSAINIQFFFRYIHPFSRIQHLYQPPDRQK
jgi:hypothetical protein